MEPDSTFRESSLIATSVRPPATILEATNRETFMCSVRGAGKEALRAVQACDDVSS